jgi:hypothetical protein
MAVPTTAERRFILSLTPTEAENGWGFVLVETTGDHQRIVVETTAARARQYRKQVCDAVVVAGYQNTSVSPRRKKPFNLTQDPGVRLALTVLALEPIIKTFRRQAISDGIAAMSSEEVLYWYAKSVSRSGSRGLRALRILLAEE